MSRRVAPSPVKVVVPYLPGMLQSGVVEAITADGYTPIMCALDAHFAYGRLVAQLAEDGEDVAIVEHDKITRRGFLATFEDCPEPWCCHRYARPGHAAYDMDFPGFGHIRLRTEALHALRSLPLAETEWMNVDGDSTKWLQRQGFTWHRHDGVVFHRHAIEATRIRYPAGFGM